VNDRCPVISFVPEEVAPDPVLVLFRRENVYGNVTTIARASLYWQIQPAAYC